MPTLEVFRLREVAEESQSFRPIDASCQHPARGPWQCQDQDDMPDEKKGREPRPNSRQKNGAHPPRNGSELAPLNVDQRDALHVDMLALQVGAIAALSVDADLLIDVRTQIDARRRRDERHHGVRRVDQRELRRPGPLCPTPLRKLKLSITRTVPPHCSQVSISIPNNRFRRCA